MKIRRLTAFLAAVASVLASASWLPAVAQTIQPQTWSQFLASAPPVSPLDAYLMPFVLPGGSGVITGRATVGQLGPYIINTYGTALQPKALSNGYLWVGNQSNLAAAVPMSGDCSILYTGATTCLKTNGVPFGTAATVNTGTSGPTVPFNNGNNTSSGNQTHSGTENFTGTIKIGGTAVTLPVPVAIGGTGAATAQTAYGNITIAPGTFYVGWYGALGVSSDDCPAIQNALDAAAAYGAAHGAGRVVFNSIAYNCLTALTFDPGVTIWEGNGATINATSFAGPVLITVAQSNRNPVKPTGNAVNQNYLGMSHTFFYGPGSASSTTWMLFSTPNQTPTQLIASNGIYTNLSAYGFGIGIDYGLNTYVTTFYGLAMGVMGWGIHSISGDAANAGENLSFIGGDIYQCAVAIYDEQGYDIRLANVSFDFNAVNFYATQGPIHCKDCHFETQKTALAVSANPVAGSLWFNTANTANSLIDIEGGDIILDGAGSAAGVSGLFLTQGGGDSTTVLSHVRLYNLILGSNSLAVGNGTMVIKDSITTNGGAGFNTIFFNGSLLNNLFADGGFEDSTIEDLVWIYGDTPLPTFIHQGTNISSVSNSADTSCVGSQSLKTVKSAAASATAEVMLAAKISSQALPVGTLTFSTLGSYTGSVTFTPMWLQITGYDGNGVPTVGKSATIGTYTSHTVTLAGAPLSCVSTGISMKAFSGSRAPTWATHIGYLMDLTNAPAGNYYLDQAIAQSL